MPSASGAARMVHRVTDMRGGLLARNTNAEREAVARLLAGQPDELMLQQMLGFAPYPSANLTDTQARHGGTHRAVTLKCQCQPCKDRMAHKLTLQKQRRDGGLNNVRTHNQWGYNRGCRCVTCREAFKDYERDRSRRKRAKCQTPTSL